MCPEHILTLKAGIWLTAQRGVARWWSGCIHKQHKQPKRYLSWPGVDFQTGSPLMLLAPEDCPKSTPRLRLGHPRRKPWAKNFNASDLLRRWSQEDSIMESRIGRKMSQQMGQFQVKTQHQPKSMKSYGRESPHQFVMSWSKGPHLLLLYQSLQKDIISTFL